MNNSLFNFVKKKKRVQNLFPLFIILFFIGDILTNIANKGIETSFTRYSGLIKLLFETVMIFLLLFKPNKTWKRFYLIITFLFFFMLSQVIFFNDGSFNLLNEVLHGNIYYLNRYFYLLLFIVFIIELNIDKDLLKKTYKIFEIFIYINSIAIIIGFTFETRFFLSFESSPRFGFSGLFSTPNETAFFYIITIITNYYLWITTNKKTKLYKTIFFVIVSLLIGQKKIVLLLFLLILYHLLIIERQKKLFRSLFLISIPFLMIYGKVLFEKLIYFFPYWEKIYRESGAINAITSFRSNLLMDAVNYIKMNWDRKNFLIGGIDFKEFKTEFELVDLYLFFGVAGIAFYLYVIWFYFLKISTFKKQLLVILVFLTSFFTGGLLINVTAAIMYFIAVNYIMVIDKSKTST